MAERCTRVYNESLPSPLSKRCRLETCSTEEESDLPEEIFPSEDESQSDAEPSCDVFYPSEDSNLVSEVEFLDKLNENSLTSATHVHSALNDENDKPDAAEETAELRKIGQLLVGTCCNQLCLRHLTATDIISSKANFVAMTGTKQKQYLIDRIKEGSCECNPKSGEVTTKYFVAGKEICGTAWAQVYGISPRTLCRMLKQLANMEEATHGNVGKKRANTKAESVSAWMDAYFNLIGDKMPDKNQIHLPSWETQKDIYSRYIGDMKDRGMSEEEIAGISAFYKIWTEQFSNVVIPQVWANTV